MPKLDRTKASPRFNDVGTFYVTATRGPGSILAIDPTSEGDQKEIKEVGVVVNNVKPGIWSSYVAVTSENDVQSLVAHNIVEPTIGRWKIVGTVPVDGGLLGIFDLTRYWKKDDDLFDSTPFIVHDKSGEPSGVISESGYGDGVYDVSVCTNDDGFVVAVKIEFFDLYPESNVNDSDEESL